MAKKIKTEKTQEEKESEAEGIAAARARGRNRFARQTTTTTKEVKITPSSRLSNRRLLRSNLDSRWGDILADPNIDGGKGEKRAKAIEYYRSSEDIDITMPKKYTLYKRYVKENIAKKDEKDYIAKAELTHTFMNNHPEILSMEDINPKALPSLDRATIRTMLEYREKPKKGLLERIF